MMIHFYIKFLICFTKPVPPLGKPTGKNVKKPPQKLNKALTTSEPIDSKPKDENLVFPDENVIDCHAKVREWCHIEYSLLEDTIPKTEINVVTWGAAAKVFTEGDFRALKTVIIGNLVWVYFIMNHKITHLEDSDVEKLKASNIAFTFSQNNNKMMPRVKNDWPKQFVTCKKKLDPKVGNELWFNELRQTDPVDETHKDWLRERFETYKITQPKKNSIVSMLIVGCCDPKTEKIITEMTSTLSVSTNLTDGERTTGKKEKLKISKLNKTEKGQVKNERRQETSKLSIRGELLIAGLYEVCSELREVTSSIPYARIVVNASQMLTDEQINAYVPLSVTIQEVENFPMIFKDFFKLKNIYACYEFYNVVNIVETIKVPLCNRNLSFNDTRVFFMSSPEEKKRNQQLMHRPSIVALAESLLTRPFVVKLYGEISEITEPNKSSSLFGEQETDQFIATPGHDLFTNYKSSAEFKTEEFLGCACFSLIQLTKGNFKVEVTSAISSVHQSMKDSMNDIDSNDLNEERRNIYERLTVKGCLPDEQLIEKNSRLKIRVSSQCMLTPIPEHQLLLIPNVFFRLIGIFKDKNIAYTVIEHITRTNYLARESSLESSRLMSITNLMKTSGSSSIQSIDGTGTTRHPSSAQERRELQKVIMTSSKSSTGFVVLTNEECILVIEATPIMFPILIEKLHYLHPPMCRVVYDTSLFFTKRIYNDFFPLSLYKIRLHKPLNILLKNASYYMKSAQPALEALFLLDLLRRSSTLHNACVSQLFPSCNQLIIFNKEFGIPSTSTSSGS